MSQIVLDSSSLAKLRAVTQPVEICDPSGRVWGRFLPQFDLSEWEIIGQELTQEELRTIERSNQKRYTTSEVIAHLEGLQ